MHKVHLRTVLAAVRAADRGHDPLHIGPLHYAEGDEQKKAIERRLAGVDENMAGDLRYEVEYQLEANPKKSIPIDPLLAELLAYVGIDPLVAVWLALQTGSLEIEDETTRWQMAKINSTSGCGTYANDTQIVIGKTSWDQNGRMYTDAIPVTSMVEAKGRMLRDVVSHPVLDREPMIIKDLSLRGDGPYKTTRIDTDHEARSATVDQLVLAHEILRNKRNIL